MFIYFNILSFLDIFAAMVSPDIEVSKHGQEHDTMAENDEAVEGGKPTVDEDGLEGVKTEGGELEHLELGQILLPPEILLNLGAEEREEVVEVHDGVDAHVEETTECCVTTTNVSDAPPSCERHDSMVDHVEGGQVAHFLSQHKKERVEIIDEFREKVPPDKVCCLHGTRAGGVVHWLALPVVHASQPETGSYFEHPSTEDCLDHVVEKDDVLDLIRSSVLHELWPPDPHYVVVEDAAHQYGPRGRHEEPVVHSGISEVDHEPVVVV